MPLNLPPGVLMQRKNIFLTLIVPGSNNSGKNMNVYLQPLMDDLKEAWDYGIWTYDAASKTNFQMHAWLMYSMHDLPAFALFVAWLSGPGVSVCNSTHDAITWRAEN